MSSPSILDTSKVIVGATGSGKTVTGKHDVQQLLIEQRHVVVIDPTGVWWGMRSNAAGTGPAFDLPIFGGDRADVPIAAGQGAAIAGILVDQRVSAIVDLSGIDNSRDWRLFMRDFVAELRRRVRGNFHLVIDEADEFAPEKPADEIAFALRENMVWLAKRGRVQGFVPTYITQRTAEIAKAVISQAQTIVAHQLIAPSDRKAIEDYLKGHGTAEQRRTVMASLSELAIGEHWTYSPRLKILERGTTPPLVTFDSSRTPAPGEVVAAPRTLTQLDVSAIRTALAPPPHPEDVVPADPAAAFQRGSEIGTLLADRDVRIRDLEERLAARDHELAQARTERLQADAAFAHIMRIIEGVPFPRAIGPQPSIDPNQRPSPTDAAADEPPAPPNRGGSSEGEGEREWRALAGLAVIYPAGLTEAAWATRTGYSRKGGAWIRRRKRYLDAGYVVQRDGRWFATADGLDAAFFEPIDMPPPGRALIEWWADRLGAPGRLLKVLAAVHPRALTRDALAAEVAMSPKGGAYLRHVSALKSAELVLEQGKRLSISPGIMGEA